MLERVGNGRSLLAFRMASLFLQALCHRAQMILTCDVIHRVTDEAETQRVVTI
jgi:hypothetical protein